jgi:hypothetical protein
MAIQLSVAVRNARLDAIESAISTGPTLEIRTGTQPANCAAADSGSVLATFTLPSDWLAAAANGAKVINGGPWQDTSADASGTAAHFRVKAGSTCHLQGSARSVRTAQTATQRSRIHG